MMGLAQRLRNRVQEIVRANVEPDALIKPIWHNRQTCIRGIMITVCAI